MMRRLLTLVLFAISFGLHAQQESMYTQFMYNKLGLNPAFAGNEDYGSATLLIRDQWNGFPGAPETQAVSINLPRYREDMGVGFNLKRNTIGITKAIKFGTAYAYKIPIASGTLSMGLDASVTSFTIDFTDSRLVATDGLNNDPSIPSTKEGRTLLNVGSGLYFNTDKYYLGVSIPGFLKNKFDFDSNDDISRRVRHLFVMGGASFDVSSRDFISVQSLFKVAENAPFDFDLGVTYTVDDKYTGGINYRFGGSFGDIAESIDVLFSFKISDRFLIGFSQDFTLSSLGKYDNGSIEIVGNYTFGSNAQVTSPVTNPRFF